MYYKSEVNGVARIPPTLFSEKLEFAVEKQLKADFEGQVFEELGKVIQILEVKEIDEGVIIPGDGAAYHRTKFVILHYVPEINEVVEGEVKDIAKFGAFIDFGPFEGMVHVSQTMDDFVSFSKSGTLTGKKSGRSLKIGDYVRAKIVAISYKDPKNPKIGLTMRQPALGKIEWIEADTKDERKAIGKVAEKEEKPKKKR
ncbi:MAG: DNA-directed RNA polymerase [Candidatus Nanoarchaeia archaeon]